MNRQGLNKMHDMGAPRPGPIKVQGRWKPNRLDPGPGTKESKSRRLRPVPRDACLCTIGLFVMLAGCRPPDRKTCSVLGGCHDTCVCQSVPEMSLRDW